ncbi:hypothetical protein F5Y18DRAFT_435398 [Xylariaceae sp. FL1019]|nr:hypothetical protein F5Y18DRAFT_435398 [Xylariaceae sp. FL1019]
MALSRKKRSHSSHRALPKSISKAIKSSEKLTRSRNLLDQYVLAEVKKDWKTIDRSDWTIREQLLRKCKLLSGREKRYLRRLARLVDEHQEQQLRHPCPDHTRNLETVRKLVNKFRQHLGPLLIASYMADHRPALKTTPAAKQSEQTLPTSTASLENAITKVRIEDVPVTAPNKAGKRKLEQLKGTQTPKKKVRFTVDPDESPTPVSRPTGKSTIVVEIPSRPSAYPLDTSSDNTATMASSSGTVSGDDSSSQSEDGSNSVQEERPTSHNGDSIDGDNILADDSHQMVTRSVRKMHNAKRKAKAAYDEMILRSFLAVDDLVYDAPKKKKRISKKKRYFEELEGQVPEMSGALVANESQLIELLLPKPMSTGSSDSDSSSSVTTMDTDSPSSIDIIVDKGGPHSCAGAPSDEDMGHSGSVIVSHDTHQQENILCIDSALINIQPEDNIQCIDPALLAVETPTRDARRDTSTGTATMEGIGCRKPVWPISPHVVASQLEQHKLSLVFSKTTGKFGRWRKLSAHWTGLLEKSSRVGTENIGKCHV